MRSPLVLTDRVVWARHPSSNVACRFGIPRAGLCSLAPSQPSIAIPLQKLGGALTMRRSARSGRANSSAGEAAAAAGDGLDILQGRMPHDAAGEPAAASSSSRVAEDAETEAERKRLWKAAIKAPMYSVGIIPVLVAAAAVFSELGPAATPWLRCGGLVLGAILVIAWLNLSNDAFDSATGVDKTKRESVVNLTGGQAWPVLALANLFLGCGLGLLGLLVGGAVAAGDPRPVWMLGAAIVCGYVYQGPPFRLSYRGLGEPLCFFAFGPLATPAFYLALLHPAVAAAAASASVSSNVIIPPLVWMLSVLVGMTTTTILFCSHFHQIEGDTKAGKRSPLVKLGTTKGVQVLKTMTALPYATLGVVSMLKILSLLGTAVAAAAVGSGGGAMGAGAGVAKVLGWLSSLLLVSPHHAGGFLSTLVSSLPWTLLPAALLSLPMARTLIWFAEENHEVPERIAPLKKYAVQVHIAFGLCLVLGLSASWLVVTGLR